MWAAYNNNKSASGAFVDHKERDMLAAILDLGWLQEGRMLVNWVIYLAPSG